MNYTKIANNCRACQMKTEEESQRIFIFNTVKLPDIFKETTSLDIHENDGLPKVLCSTCYDRLLEAYNFRKMCSAAVVHFQKILSMDVPEEKYILPENLPDAHLTDTTQKDIKTEPDLDAPNSPPPRDHNCLPDEDDSLTDISDTLSIDDTLPEILKTDPDDDAPLISRKTQEQQKDPRSQKTIPPILVWCGICNSKFFQKSRLEMHMKAKHLGLKSCECKICGKEMHRKTLANHMATKHSKIKLFYCPESECNCEKYFHTKSGLNRHMKTAHGLQNSKLPGKKAKVKAEDFEVSSPEHKASTSQVIHLNTQGVPEADEHQKDKNVCQICRVEKATADELKSHIYTHKKGNRWCCVLCTYKCSRRDYLQHHVKAVHYGVKDYHCLHCEKSFMTEKSLKHHILIHESILMYKCKFCGIKKISLTEVKQHERIHTKISDTLPDKPTLQEELNSLVWCGICNSKFRRKSRLEMHMREKHLGLKPCECKICGKQFSGHALEYHMAARHGKEKPFPCPKSQRRKHVNTKSGLKSNMETKHAVEELAPSGSDSKDPPSLKNSITRKVGKSTENQKTINQHNCGICGAKKDAADELESHINTHLKDDMWCCLFCSYKSDKKESLIKHVKDVHHGKKDYHCPHCDRIFVTAMGLKQHKLRLKGILNFKCKFCDIRKVSLAEVRRHENTHTKEKIFSCEFCPHKSTCKRNMRNHVTVVHQGVRNFHCPHCERSFGTAETLKNHVLTHTGERPHACSECGKKFIQLGQFRNHMKTHIKSESKSEIKEEIQDSS